MICCQNPYQIGSRKLEIKLILLLLCQAKSGLMSLKWKKQTKVFFLVLKSWLKWKLLNALFWVSRLRTNFPKACFLFWAVPQSRLQLQVIFQAQIANLFSCFGMQMTILTSSSPQTTSNCLLQPNLQLLSAWSLCLWELTLTKTLKFTMI
jgi:hypothetical protein